MTKEEFDTCKKDCIVFDDNDCITKVLDYLWSLNGEPKRLIDDKVVEYRLRIHAHNGSGFDVWIILNNLTWERDICKIIKSGKGIFSINIFTGYVINDKNKSLPQCVYFEYGITHLFYSLEKSGTNYKKKYLKKGMNHADVYSDTWRNEKDEDEWLVYVKSDVVCMAFS